jgi:hypothetical protein
MSKHGTTLVATALVMSVCGRAAGAPPALEYINQAQEKVRTKNRSAIMTSDKLHVFDFQFDEMVRQAIDGKVKQAVFNFNQCNGGGMIDELLGRNLGDAVFTSAARHDQCSFARGEDNLTGIDPHNPNIRRTESTYSFRYITKAANGGSARQIDAATKARAEDICGPFSPNKTWKGTTSPQYTSTGAAADGIRLHKEAKGTKYRAILWGGSTQLDRGESLDKDSKNMVKNIDLAANWNTLERAHAQLLQAGYTEDEMLVLYTGGHERNNDGSPKGKIFKGGPAMPAWVDGGTRYEDMRYAWTDWMKNGVDDKTQVFFWSSFGHGTSMSDVAAQRKASENPKIEKGSLINFEMDLDLAGQMLQVKDAYPDGTAEDGADARPYFLVLSEVEAPGLQIELNGSVLPLLAMLPNADGQFEYKFGLSDAALAGLQSLDQSVIVNYNFAGTDGGAYDLYADFITSMGPTLGDFANFPLEAVPAPGAAGLMALAGLLGSRRKREAADAAGK